MKYNKPRVRPEADADSCMETNLLDPDFKLIQNMRIAAPCSMDWNSMTYTEDGRIRFCGQCKLNVYSLSEMSTKEAASLIREKEGKLCMRLYRRRDGTVITDNCPVGLRKMRDKARRLIAVAIATFAWLGVPLASNASSDGGNQSAFSEPHSVTMGGTAGTVRVTGPTLESLLPAIILSVSGTLATGLLLRKLVKKRKASLWALGAAAAVVMIATGIVWGALGSNWLLDLMQ